MSGPNEHHIPRFFQRAFAVKRKGGEPNEIWHYRAGDEPELSSIAQTASEDHFYGVDLDTKLKIPENILGSHFASLRKAPIGAAVDGALAADLVSHLAPRSRHFRASIATGIRQMMSDTQALLGDRDKLEALVGLDGEQPSALFLEKMEEAIGSYSAEVEAVGLPRPLLDRISFILAKEQFDSVAESSVASMSVLLRKFASDAPKVVRDGHNRALDRLADGVNPRRDLLAGFDWTFEAAPATGAILPDCVAMALSPGESFLPLVFVGADIEAVVMPLTKEKLLVGRAPDKPAPDLAAFNEEAASCSEEFFLAHMDAPELRELVDRIGRRSSRYLEEAMSEVLEANAPRKGGSDAVAENHLALSEDDLGFSYDVRLFDFGDPELTQRLANAVNPIVEAFAKLLPLSRLDGITFASDYQAALRSCFPDPGGHTSGDADDGSNAGLLGEMAVIVRDGRAKGRIVLSILVADYLLRDVEEEIAFGRRILVHQIILVVMLELLERAFPDSILSHRFDDELDAWLAPYVADARSGYVAARIAGEFGEGPELANFYRSSLIAALKQLKAISDKERRSFAMHRDVERLATATFPLTARVLYFASVLLAHCEASGEDILDADGILAAILEDMGLKHWLVEYAKDLDRFRLQFGRWTSIAELFRFSRHVERVLWSVVCSLGRAMRA